MKEFWLCVWTGGKVVFGGLILAILELAVLVGALGGYGVILLLPLMFPTWWGWAGAVVGWLLVLAVVGVLER